MAAPTPKRGTELPMIDTCMIVVTTTETSPRCIAVQTASKIGVEVQTEDTEAVKLVVKNVLLAQKPAQKVITGHTITLTDNVTILELIEILQGGEITKEADTNKITGYTPPVAGEPYAPVKFVLDAYSAQYSEGGNVVQYEKMSYPNCSGNPISLGSEDNVFRINEYTINSAPEKGDAPYTLTFVDALPTVTTV